MFDKYLTKTGLLSKNQPQDIKNQWYTKKFREIHGLAYDYSLVMYKNNVEKVLIVCSKHGAFSQAPKSHLQGQGCPKCFIASKAGSTQGFISQQVEIHGDLYNYDRVQYQHSHSDVLIFCKTHGIFPQQPRVHLQGKGCPKCQVSNQNILYILKCLDTSLVKIGITNNLTKRISNIGGSLEYLHHAVVDNPREHEKILHSIYKPCNVFNPNVRNGGTEFFQLSQQQIQEVIYYLNSVQQGEF